MEDYIISVYCLQLSIKTQIEKYTELSEKTPLAEKVEALYIKKKERLQDQNYYRKTKLRNCKPHLRYTHLIALLAIAALLG